MLQARTAIADHPSAFISADSSMFTRPESFTVTS